MRLLLFLLAVTAFLSSPAREKNPAEKILLVQVTEIGVITVNRDTIGSDNLAIYIQERLFKSYLGTGKMHSRIKLQKATSNVPDMVTEVIVKEIKDAQRRALIELSLQKYNRTFDNLEERRKDKLKKMFPVLFQESFT
jgi:hypothetical protein